MYRLLISIAVLCTSSSAIGSTILFDQHPADPTTRGLRSNFPGAEFDAQAANPFSLFQDSSVTSVTWSGFFWQKGDSLGLPNVDFTIRFYQGDDVLRFFENLEPPGALISSQTVTASLVELGQLNFSGFRYYQFSASLPEPVALRTGIAYWLSILESDVRTDRDFVWMGSQVSGGFYFAAARYFEGDAWSLTSGEFAFALAGNVVAEPTAYLLAHVSVCFVAFRLRRSAASRPR